MFLMTKLKKMKGDIPARYVLAMMIFTATFCSYVLRLNLNIAIIKMAKTRGKPLDGTSSPACSSIDNKTYLMPISNSTDEKHENDQVGSYDWDEYTQGLILSSYYWGYLLTQIPGGRIAEKYGAKRIVGYCMFLNAVLSMLTPIISRIHYAALISLRIGQGILQGSLFPSLNALLANWVSVNNRSKYVSCLYGGTFAIVVTLPISGLVASAFGWEAVFYATGAFVGVWCLLWVTCTYDSPSKHPRILLKEKEAILCEIGDNVNREKTADFPWKSVITSTPAIANVVAHFGTAWGIHFLVTEGPSYMYQVLGFSLKANGLLSSLPPLFRYLGAVGFGIAADWMISSNLMSKTATRKSFVILTLAFPGALLLGLAYSGCNRDLSYCILIVAFGCNGAASASTGSNAQDLSPNYAGTLYGICNTFGTVAGLLVPIVVGILTNNNQNISQWQKVFLIGSSVFFVSCIVFLVFGSGEIQPWNTPVEENNKEKPGNDDTIISNTGKFKKRSDDVES